MQSWIDSTFALGPHERPFITMHDKAVTLHLPGYLRDGHGFCLRFEAAHLGVIRKLCADLETLAEEARAAADEEPLPALAQSGRAQPGPTTEESQDHAAV